MTARSKLRSAFRRCAVQTSSRSAFRQRQRVTCRRHGRRVHEDLRQRRGSESGHRRSARDRMHRAGSERVGSHRRDRDVERRVEGGKILEGDPAAKLDAIDDAGPSQPILEAGAKTAIAGDRERERRLEGGGLDEDRRDRVAELVAVEPCGKAHSKAFSRTRRRPPRLGPRVEPGQRRSRMDHRAIHARQSAVPEAPVAAADDRSCRSLAAERIRRIDPRISRRHVRLQDRHALQACRPPDGVVPRGDANLGGMVVVGQMQDLRSRSTKQCSELRHRWMIEHRALETRVVTRERHPCRDDPMPQPGLRIRHQVDHKLLRSSARERVDRMQHGRCLATNGRAGDLGRRRLTAARSDRPFQPRAFHGAVHPALQPRCDRGPRPLRIVRPDRRCSGSAELRERLTIIDRPEVCFPGSLAQSSEAEGRRVGKPWREAFQFADRPGSVDRVPWHRGVIGVCAAAR
jgi:hypothetical protein